MCERERGEKRESESDRVCERKREQRDGEEGDRGVCLNNGQPLPALGCLLLLRSNR